MKTEFIPIPGYSNYLINQDGEIYSLFSKRNINPITIKHSNGATGKIVFISGDDKPRRGIYVHYLVALSFIPNPENCKWVGHKNGDLNDNRVENLFWRKKKNNNLPPLQRLTPEQAMDIYHLSQNRRLFEIKLIAKIFGVQVQTVNKIKNKTLWGQLHD